MSSCSGIGGLKGRGRTENELGVENIFDEGWTVDGAG